MMKRKHYFCSLLLFFAHAAGAAFLMQATFDNAVLVGGPPNQYGDIPAFIVADLGPTVEYDCSVAYGANASNSEMGIRSSSGKNFIGTTCRQMTGTANGLADSIANGVYIEMRLDSASDTGYDLGRLVLNTIAVQGAAAGASWGIALLYDLNGDGFYTSEESLGEIIGTFSGTDESAASFDLSAVPMLVVDPTFRFYVWENYDGASASQNQFGIEQITLLKPGTIVSNPHLDWACAATHVDSRVQIASDDGFAMIIDEDVIHNYVHRYVPGEDLVPGTYWWRVRGILSDGSEGDWSPTEIFTVFDPASLNQYPIPAGATASRIRSQIALAAANAPARVLFASNGTYTITGLSDEYLLDLDNVYDVVIDGNGSTFVLSQSNNVGFCAADNCARVEFRNLSVDYDTPTHLAMEIKNIDGGNSRLLCETLSGYPTYAEDPWYYEGMASGCWVLDADCRKMKLGAIHKFDVVNSNSYAISATEFSFKIEDNNAGWLDGYKPGDILIKDRKKNKKLFYLNNTEDLTIADVTTYNGLGFGLNGTRNEKLKILRYTMARRNDLYLSTQSDGLHWRECRIGPWIEGCSVGYNGDDTLNIRANRHNYTASAGSANVSVETDGSVFEIGDTLIFPDGNFGQFSEHEILSVTPNGGWADLVLADSVSVDSTHAVKVVVLDYSGGRTVIRNNLFHEARGDGMLVALDGGLIENNRFVDNGESSVAISPSEGGGCRTRNVIIRNNEMVNNTRHYGSRNPVLIFKHGYAYSNLNENIHVVGNTISGYGSSALEIRSCTNVFFKGNRISNGEWHDLDDVADSVVHIENSSAVSFSGNRILDTRDRTGNFLTLINSADPDFDRQIVDLAWESSGTGITQIGNADQPNRSYSEFTLSGSARFATLPMRGNCLVEAKVESTDSTGGVVLDTVALQTASVGQIQLVSNSSTQTVISASNWLALERHDDIVDAFVSLDGETWTWFGAVTNVMNQTVDAGLFTLGGESIFDHVDVDFTIRSLDVETVKPNAKVLAGYDSFDTAMVGFDAVESSPNTRFMWGQSFTAATNWTLDAVSVQRNQHSGFFDSQDHDTKIKLVLFSYNQPVFDGDTFGDFDDPVPSGSSTVALYTEEFSWTNSSAAGNWLTFNLLESQELLPGEYGFGLWLSNPDSGGYGTAGGTLELRGSGDVYAGGVRLRARSDNGNTIQSGNELNFVLQGFSDELTGYGAWAEQYGLVYGPDGHDDADGFDNLHEYGIGGNPTNTFDTGYPVQFTFNSTNGLYIHPQGSDPDSGILYFVETSTNLVSNVWKTNGVEIVGEEIFSKGWKSVTNQIPMVGNPQQFIRLRIEEEGL